jgi:hypothetical protein
VRAPAEGALLSPRHRPFITEEELIPSESVPGVWWTVRRYADGSMDCDCPDYCIRQRPVGGECKHLRWWRNDHGWRRYEPVG